MLKNMSPEQISSMAAAAKSSGMIPEGVTLDEEMIKVRRLLPSDHHNDHHSIAYSTDREIQNFGSKFQRLDGTYAAVICQSLLLRAGSRLHTRNQRGYIRGRPREGNQLKSRICTLI